MKIPQEKRVQMASSRRRKADGIGELNEPDAQSVDTPRILLLGPPGSGKTTLALALAAQYGVVLVSVDIEAREAANSGSEQGNQLHARFAARPTRADCAKIRFSLVAPFRYAPLWPCGLRGDPSRPSGRGVKILQHRLCTWLWDTTRNAIDNGIFPELQYMPAEKEEPKRN